MNRVIVGAGASIVALLAVESTALAQFPGGGAGRGRPSNAPTQSSPTQTRTVGPRGGGDDDDSRPTVTQRAEPTAQAPADPLAIPPELRARIGSDWDGSGASPRRDAGIQRSIEFPYYQESRGDYRFRTLPPFWFEHTRGLRDAGAPPKLEGIPSEEDRQSLIFLLYYNRRSPKHDADVVFPAFWRLRDGDSQTIIAGPIVHRDAPGENDNWLAPLFFSGTRKDGGYFHSLPLLTYSHHDKKGAFALVGPYFRDRTGSDVDVGLVPFFFHGDNGNVDGARKTYTLIPPLLFYHRERELDQSTTTIAGPVVIESTPKRSVFDIAPLFFHMEGKPETGGVRESHTTLFPFFHYGYSPDRSLFVTPLYLRRTSPTADTMITPLFAHASSRKGASELTTAGPIVPLYFNLTDRDLGLHAFALAPFYYQSDSPVGHDWLTPLVGRFETYGISKTWWVFPTMTFTTDTSGWAANLHPLLYFGRSGESSHSVIAPIYWDFASKDKRSTVGFPLFWRFADHTDDSVTQLAVNTVYMQKRVVGGLSWQFHFFPLFSYGENPEGYFWNVLYGLAGYERAGSYGRAKAFWVPFQVSGPSAGHAGRDGTPGAF